MMSSTNRQWKLTAYPTGMPQATNWDLVECPIPKPGANELLVQALYWDVAPYMRGRISPKKNYATGVSIGDVMVSGAIGKVIHSNSPAFQTDEIVVTDMGFGWQDFAVLSPANIRRVDPTIAPLPCWLDFMGINGLTAYFGLVEAAVIKPGDTVVVSAATGSVGQLVGQIAKIAGCRTIAITSSEDKINWCRELGYDEGLNYRTEPDLAAALGRVCPDGIDVFFDNTSGPIHDAVLQNLAAHARITLCGTVSLADRFDEPDIGPRFLRQILVARARIQGFLVLDYQLRYPEAWQRLTHWYNAGLINQKYDIDEGGLTNLPSAFLRLLNGQKFGKQLVKALPLN
ncbi:MAG: NADP-dependent oxidoreductase [Spirulina sp. SIO3F2]|nr:NADP-dependent oxidoreductase [Spirulina sp. SIO3F2]